MTTEIKKLRFASGVDVGAPTDLTSVPSTTSLGEYVDDAAFVAANGAAAGGDSYINTTLRCLRVFTGSAWRNHIVASDAADATKVFEVDVSGNDTGVTSTLQFNDTADSVHDVPPGSNTLAVYPIVLGADTYGVLPVTEGGTGEITAEAAINALVPVQTGNIGKFLSTDGTSVSWEDAAGGSGSGSGEINAVLNPNDANAGWTGSGSHTVTGLASGSPLDPIIPTGIRITSTSSSGESSTSGVGYEITTMPESLYNKKLKLDFYFKTPISTDWAVSIYAGATRISLSSDVAGVSRLPRNMTNRFVAFFDAKDDVTYSIRWTRVALSGTTSLDLTNVIVGPGISANSAIVGQWIPWTPTSPTWGIAADYSGRYRQVGQNKEYQVRIDFSGNTNPGQNGVINLPPGDAISSTNFIGPSGSLCVIKSDGSFYDGVSSAYRVGATYQNSTQILLNIATTVDDRLGAVTDTFPFTIAAGAILIVEFEVPIAALDGAGTINIGTPDVEYIYNSNTTDTDNSTSFAYGAEGTQFGFFTALRFQRVRSRYPIGPLDKVYLETTSNEGLYWEPYQQSANISTRTEQNGVQYGAFWAPVNSTDLDVYFGQYMRTTGATYGSAGTAWSSVSSDPNYKWRVAIHRGPSPVGFSHVTQAQSGLVRNAGQLLGTNTNDNASAGFVGEYVEFIQTNPITLTTSVASDIATMNLTSGDWDVWAVSSFDTNGTVVSQVLSVESGISTVSVTTSSFPGQWFNQTLPAYNSGTFGLFYVSSPISRVSFSTTSSVYCVCFSLFTAGAGALRAFSTKLMARRVR